MGRKRSAIGWWRTAPPVGTASSWLTICRCPRSWWAAASPPGLFRLDAGEPRLLGVGLQLRLHEFLEVRRRIGDRLDADLGEAVAHAGGPPPGAHLAPQPVAHVRRRAGQGAKRRPRPAV